MKEQYKTAGTPGFTLTELLVVIAIITILATITIPNVIGFIERGRIASTLSDVRNADTSLSGMLSDAGVDSFQDFLTPEARFVLDNYDQMLTPDSGLSPEDNLALLYRTMYYTLLRLGRDAALEENIEGAGGLREMFQGLEDIQDAGGNDLNVNPGDRFYFFPDGDPDENAVFDVAVTNKLRSSYMVLGTDSWGNQYHFWMGPLGRGTVADPVPLRSFRIVEADPTQVYVWDAANRALELEKVPGQPPADDEDGYPAPTDLPVYIWSDGPNELQDAHLDYLSTNDPVYQGGGDDINNWDFDAGWESAPRPE